MALLLLGQLLLGYWAWIMGLKTTKGNKENTIYMIKTINKRTFKRMNFKRTTFKMNKLKIQNKIKYDITKYIIKYET